MVSREDGVGIKGAGGGAVGCHKPVDFFTGEMGEAGTADRGGCGEDSPQVIEEAMSFNFFVK